MSRESWKEKNSIFSVNFQLNLAVWHIKSMCCIEPDAAIMSEWPIYILWKLIAMFMLITCKLYILVWNKDHVTS